MEEELQVEVLEEDDEKQAEHLLVEVFSVVHVSVSPVEHWRQSHQTDFRRALPPGGACWHLLGLSAPLRSVLQDHAAAEGEVVAVQPSPSHTDIPEEGSSPGLECPAVEEESPWQ